MLPRRNLLLLLTHWLLLLLLLVLLLLLLRSRVRRVSPTDALLLMLLYHTPRWAPLLLGWIAAD